MKKYIFIAICLSYCMSISAQEYQPFPKEENTYWKHEWMSFFSMDRGYYQYEIVGDTIINDLTYHKLWYKSESYYIENGETTYQSKYYGAFREDITAKKVYFLAPNASAENLMYDFNLEIGDTVQTSDDDEQIFFVSAIDSVLLGDEKYHKKFIISVKNCEWHPEDEPFSCMIEGLGRLEGLFSRFQCIVDGGTHWLSCVANDDYSLYGGYCTPIVVSIPRLEKEKEFSIFPNPAQTSSTIDLVDNEQIYFVDIFNLQGQSVKSIPAVQIRQNIDIDDLSNGMYLVRLATKQGESFYKKLIIIK